MDIVLSKIGVKCAYLRFLMHKYTFKVISVHQKCLIRTSNTCFSTTQYPFGKLVYIKRTEIYL